MHHERDRTDPGDGPQRAITIAASAHRLAVRLYPAQFHRTYADELDADFEASSVEALTERGWSGLGQTWARTLIDLMSSLAREWLRTPWIPVLTVAAAVAALVVIASIARVQGPLRAYRLRVAPGSPPVESPELFLLMVMIVLVPVALIILVSGVLLLGGRRSPLWRQPAPLCRQPALLWRQTFRFACRHWPRSRV